ncbi:glycosyltransferase [Vibrio kanaloae]|uniref:glycosyltransferase n=1 Tax=Vibrio kanaloae TaxID=170673 RepID=UPI001F22F3AB|nr:glycosyltransferase [Vibrio kanaloae]UIJ40619.1 glycosyltransferase [Vibrio kanaloae]
MKNLLIITEVDFEPENNSFRNSSVNIIVKEYAKYFDHVVVYCPSKVRLDNVNFHRNVTVYTSTRYTKKIKDRMRFLLSIRERINIKEIISRNNINHIQVRIPSIFSFICCGLARDVERSYYVAGDWLTSFSSNFSFPGSSIVARFLKMLSIFQIKDSKVVTAGPVLTELYSKYTSKVHPYMSTTHTSYNSNSAVKDWKKICCVGRLEPLKRVEDIIRALYILNNDNEGYTLDICGDGKLREKLQNLVKELKLENSVNFHGNISSRSDLERVYSQSGFMVLSSISEGTPKVIPESMSLGCVPIAVENVGSIDRIIENNINGLLVKEKSPESIADSIKTVNKNPNLKKNIINGGREYALDHTIASEVKKLWEFVYESD